MTTVMRPQTSTFPVNLGRVETKLLTAVVAILAMFAVTLLPADSMPTKALPASVGEVIESPFVHDAGAIKIRTYRTGFELTLTAGEVNWLVGLSYTVASAAVCGALAPTIVGGVICAAAAYSFWSVVQKYTNFPRGACLKVGIRWWGTVHSVKAVRC